MALRTPLSVTPHLYMGDSAGRPLDMGTVYFGEQDKDPEFYPINLFSDDELTKPLMQPVHTKGGYLYDKGDMVEPHAKEIIYSVKVLDSYGRKVFYKGAMMRNSWNDDVIEQINTAIIGSADVARQVAIDITNDVINSTAVEGGILADTFVTVDNTLNQRTLNKGVESINELLAIDNPKDGLRVYVKSYHAGEGVGGGYFIYNSDKSGDNDGGTVINGWVRILSSESITPFMFGAKGDGVTDDYPAFFNCLNAYPTRSGLDIFLPSRTFKISKSLFITRFHRIWSAGGKERASATLDFENATISENSKGVGAGILILHPTSITKTVEAYKFTLPVGQVGTYGAGAYLSGFQVIKSPKSGILVNAPSKLEVQTNNNTEHGIMLAANKGGIILGNANHSKLSSCKANYNGGHGIYILGSDANTFKITDAMLFSNGGWGIADQSLLGGVVISCESDSNGLGSYATLDNTPTRTVWVGNYSEGGTNPRHYSVSQRCVIIGALGATPESGQPYMGGVTGSGMVFSRGVNVASGDQLALDIGGTTGLASRLDAGNLQLRTIVGKPLLTIESKTSPNYIDFVYDNTPFMRIPTVDVAGTVKTGVPYLRYGISLGMDTSCHITAAAAPPTTGYHAKGERIYNTNPTAGGVDSWVCITTNYNGGVWKEVGIISA